MLALNTNEGCMIVACSAGSAQKQGLRAELRSNTRPCVLAYLHHPRYSSADPPGNSDSTKALWQALHEGGADVVLAGHAHAYERFAPQDPNGNLDPARGVREFVVGTGGHSLHQNVVRKANSQSFGIDAFGVLALALRPGSYDWRFVPEGGKTFSDSGTDVCR